MLKKAQLQPFAKPKFFNDAELGIYRQRCYILSVVLMLTVALLAARLWYLQVIQGEEMRAKSERNRVRYLRIQPPRGKILDRFGRVIAGVRPGYNLCLIRQEVKEQDIEPLLARLAPIIKEDMAAIRSRLHVSRSEPRYLPVVLARNLDWETLCYVEAHLSELPGVMIEIAPAREYTNGNLAPHFIGYLGEVSEDELKKEGYSNAKSGDVVGKLGVEARYNQELMGVAGSRVLEVDAVGRMEQELESKPYVVGDDVYLTIDLELQKAAEEAMEGQVGAIVAMEANTGRILAIVSSPKFDPSVFEGGLSQQKWKELNDPVYKPLFNRPLQGTYAPGSTFKPVLAVGALAEGVVNENTAFFCSGSMEFAGHTFRCWNEHGHGSTSLYRAIVESCDVYFYNVGLKLGVDRIAKYARLLGLGEKTGIELPNENAGIIPDTAWKKKRFKDKWHEGETLSVSIGQGYVSVTPLQMARAYAAIANGGTLYHPQFVEKIVRPTGEVSRSFHAQADAVLNTAKRNLELVRNGLMGVVQDERGTGKKARVPGVNVAGKTGTAQVVKQEKRKQDESMAWKYKDHAWFVCYAPAENPDISVAVLVEHGGHGGSAAAPIAQKILAKWFELQAPRPQAAQGRTT
jgi:penicillin-binding protein 2